MAIQNRRGAYGNFDPTKMVAGEFAVVQDNDPNSTTGRSLYICFEPGVVKRIADYEDIQDMVAEVAEEYVEDFDEAVTALTTLIPATEQAKDDANAAATAAQAIVDDGNAALGHAYGVCDTAYGTSAKEVTITNFQLVTGGVLSIRFTYGLGEFNSLNVNNTGAVSIKFRGYSNGLYAVGPNDTVVFMYDGTYFQVISIERNTPLRLNFGTISSLPITKNKSYINSYMICTNAEIGTPSVLGSDLTVTTSDGSITISGTISGSTTLQLVLETAPTFVVS